MYRFKVFIEFCYSIASVLHFAYLAPRHLSLAQAYEAFPIYEKELLGPAAAEDNGWSLYLPKELLADDPALTLCVESGGERYLCPLGN